MRVAKYIAASGICSRRDAEKLIAAGVVTLNGQRLDSPATNIADGDIVSVDGQEIALQQQIRLWLYHKQAGLVTTHKDEQGRRTVFETIEGLPRVISVGRLDLNSEGLLLLTNSGELASYLERPSNKFERIYKVRAFGDGRMMLANCAKDGGLKCKIDRINYTLKRVHSIDSKKSKNQWYEVILQEGKNREIRRVFEYFGLQVSRLIRTQYAGYKLGNLAPGRLQEVAITKNILTAINRKNEKDSDK